MTSEQKNTVMQGLTDAMKLFPFSLAVGVCSGFGIMGGCVAALMCLICGACFGFAFLPSWLVLLPVYAITFRFGSAAGAVSVLMGGVFAFFISLIPKEKREQFFSPSVYSGFMLATAFSTTALQTTNYFGIGAIGGTVTEIIRDYVSLGFHPNWRGVMYGTIVMVVLITYPRKFKSFSKKVPAVFVALLITFLMHLALVPHAEGTPLDEVGAFSFKGLLDGLLFRGDIPKGAIPAILCAGLSLALLMTKDLERKAIRGLSVTSLLSGAVGGVPVQTDGTPRGPLPVLVCAVATVLLYLCPGLSRMTVHSLAVILIVIAWQDVQWGEIKKSLTGGVCPVILFVCAVTMTVVVGVHYAVPLLMALSVLFVNKDRKERS